MAVDSGIEIELTEDVFNAHQTIEGLEGAAGADATAGKPEEIEGIEDLRKQLEDERRERQSAERRATDNDTRARSAESEASSFRTQSLDSHIYQMSSALSEVKVRREGLERDYEAALTSGDYSKASKLQGEMSELAAAKITIEQRKGQLEAAKRVPATETKPGHDGSPVEALIANGRLSPTSAAWLRKNPRFAEGADNHRMMAAHNTAMADGHAPDTAGYFSAINKTLGVDGEGSAAPPATKRTPPVVSAPPNRESAGSTVRPTIQRIRLTAEEVEMGEMMGLTKEDIAKSKLVQLQEKQKAGR